MAKTLNRLPADVTERDASALLNCRLGDIANGAPVAIRAERVTITELLDDMIQEYKTNGRRSLERVEDAVGHVRQFFGDRPRAHNLTTARVRDYISERQAAKASNATINRELAALKRAFSIAVEERKVVSPHIRALEERNARQGFFERDQFEAVMRHLPDAIRPAATFAYITGWRRSEIKTFRRSWLTACKAARVPGRIFHDFRRTAVRTSSALACHEAWP